MYLKQSIFYFVQKMNDMESDPSSDEEEMMMKLDHYFKSPQVKDVNSVLRSSSCNRKKMANELNQQDCQSQFRLFRNEKICLKPHATELVWIGCNQFMVPLKNVYILSLLWRETVIDLLNTPLCSAQQKIERRKLKMKWGRGWHYQIENLNRYLFSHLEGFCVKQERESLTKVEIRK